jgi:hypothetical protein
MKPSKVHTCVLQEKIAMKKAEPSAAKKCKCSKYVSYEEADKEVKQGAALWVVVSRERGTQDVPCPLCKGDKEFVNCDRCKGRGEVSIAREWDKYNGDIVLVSHRTKSNRISTSKAPTIEEEHIIRAVDHWWGRSDKASQAAADRIEEYNELTQKSLQSFGAALKSSNPEKAVAGRPEPENRRKGHAPGTITFKDGTKNKNWWWEVEGRDFDYGRAV